MDKVSCALITLVFSHTDKYTNCSNRCDPALHAEETRKQEENENNETHMYERVENLVTSLNIFR